jgi:hypothetical protein
MGTLDEKLARLRSFNDLVHRSALSSAFQPRRRTGRKGTTGTIGGARANSILSLNVHDSYRASPAAECLAIELGQLHND